MTAAYINSSQLSSTNVLGFKLSELVDRAKQECHVSSSTVALLLSKSRLSDEPCKTHVSLVVLQALRLFNGYLNLILSCMVCFNVMIYFKVASR